MKHESFAKSYKQQQGSNVRYGFIEACCAVVSKYCFSEQKYVIVSLRIKVASRHC